MDPDAPIEPLHSVLRLIRRHISDPGAALAAFVALGVAAGIGAAYCLVTLAAALAGDHVRRIDDGVLRWFDALRSPALDRIMTWITTLGNGIVVITVAAAVCTVLWLTRHNGLARVLLASVIGALALNNVLKFMFARQRPAIVEWGEQVASYSFPSGHAMAALATYGGLAWVVIRLATSRRVRRIATTILALLIVAIGISRTYLGVHYPSDVVAGFIAGSAWLAFVLVADRAVRILGNDGPAP